MNSTTRNRLLAVGALLVAGSGLAFIAFGDLGQNLVYYWTPSEMVAHGDQAYKATIRLGGIVQKGSLSWNGAKTELTFRVADNKEPTSRAVTVMTTEVPPQMFREGIGVVVEGTWDKGQVFTSHRLMVNHSNEYRPPKPGDNKDDWKKSLAEPTASRTAPASEQVR